MIIKYREIATVCIGNVMKKNSNQCGEVYNASFRYAVGRSVHSIDMGTNWGLGTSSKVIISARKASSNLRSSRSGNL